MGSWRSAAVSFHQRRRRFWVVAVGFLVGPAGYGESGERGSVLFYGAAGGGGPGR